VKVFSDRIERSYRRCTLPPPAVDIRRPRTEIEPVTPTPPIVRPPENDAPAVRLVAPGDPHRLSVADEIYEMFSSGNARLLDGLALMVGGLALGVAHGLDIGRHALP